MSKPKQDWKRIWNSAIIEEEWENPSLKRARRILLMTQVWIAVCCITFVIGTGCAWHSSQSEAKPASSCKNLNYHHNRAKRHRQSINYSCTASVVQCKYHASSAPEIGTCAWSCQTSKGSLATSASRIAARI